MFLLYIRKLDKFSSRPMVYLFRKFLQTTVHMIYCSQSSAYARAIAPRIVPSKFKEAAIITICLMNGSLTSAAAINIVMLIAKEIIISAFRNFI